MSFSVYNYEDYKSLIKDRVKDLRTGSPKYSLQFLAKQMGVQNTYFSKILNSPQHHLSEDQVFIIGQSLRFLHDEIDYLMLLRSAQASQDKSRQNYLLQKIGSLKKSHALSVDKMEAPPSHFDEDIKYLMDYYVVTLHVALWIKEFREHPEWLSKFLPLSQKKIFEIISLLDRMGKIDWDPDSRQVKKVHSPRTHFGKDHPLTRTHQLIMKTYLNQMSLNKDESQKDNFFATFTTDQKGFQTIKNQIKEFIAQIQKTSFAGKHKGVYQLNVDFLEVFSLEDSGHL